jgi:hypothetical protein
LATPTSYGPPPVPPISRRRRGGVVAPLILIFIGGVFLLQNTGHLPPNYWINLWRLWPLLLVLIGIELLLAHRVAWFVLAGIAAVALILGAVVTYASLGVSGAGDAYTSTVQTTLGAASEAAVAISFGAGQLNVGPIEQPGPGELATMTYSGPRNLAPQASYSASGGLGQLNYQTSGRSGPGFPPFLDGSSPAEARMDLGLAPNVAITDFVVQTGATDAHLDLSTLQVSSIDMSIGAATAWVRFPQAGVTTAHITGGASTITLEIPQGVAAQIQHGGGLSTLNVDQTRFPQASAGVFRSPDYDTAQNKLDLDVQTGVTTIQVN